MSLIRNALENYHDCKPYELLSGGTFDDWPVSSGLAPWASLSDSESIYPETLETPYEFASNYVYRPLDPKGNEIRLLRVFTFGDALRGSINHVSLDNPPPYYALSYTWGSWQNFEYILIGDDRIQITRNLAAALKSIPLADLGNVWIDAICIDQDNASERNHQVNKMRAIYEQAKCVKIWLGLAANNSKEAFELAKVLSRRRNANQSNSQVINDPKVLGHFRAFQSLLQRAYWTRVWVIQEANSAKDIEIFCGLNSIPWSDLLGAQNAIESERKALWKLVRDNPSLYGFTSDVWYAGPRGLLSHIGTNEPTLFEALRWHSTKLSSLPEDKVYALVGITTAKNDPRFVVDYNRGVERIFIDTASYIINTTRKLDVICSMQRVTEGKLALPSWAVDWVDIYTSPLHDNMLGTFYASGSTEVEPYVLFQSNTLSVKGFSIGTVSWVGRDTMLRSDNEESEILALCRDFHHARIEKFGRVQGANIMDLVSFCKTFTCDRLFREEGMLMNLPDGLAQETLLGLFAIAALDWSFYDPGNTSKAMVVPDMFRIRDSLGAIMNELGRVLRENTDPVNLKKWGHLILRDLKTILERRSFCICDNGTMASVYYKTTVGCKICILFGCSTPVILRPVPERQGHYEVVGDAYVEQYMHGEGMLEVEEKIRHVTDLILI